MSRKTVAQKGFLARLRRNEAGNVLAMTAAGIFPLMGMVGGAVDMARIYTIRARLQAACDAGALAGRRVMGTGQWSDNSGRANTIAQNAFDLNFKTDFFGSENRIRTFTETDGTVTGTASADVPMTLMRLFGTPTKTVAVTCDGMMRIPNTDVMFVLDNSGSMACLISESSCSNTSYNRSRYDSKLSGLKRAVKCFYEALAKQNINDVTPTDCGTSSDPTGGLSSQIQLRFGFVNYDHMVNVGKLLPNDYLVDTGDYQSRTTVQDPSNPTSTSYGSWTYYSGPSPSSNTQSNQNSCTESNTVTTTSGPSTTTTSTDSMGGTVTTTVESQTKNGTEVECTQTRYGRNPRWTRTTTTYTNYVEHRSVVTSPNYTYVYKKLPLNVSGLKAGGSNWNSSVNLPIGWMNANTSISWEGCIQERRTAANTDGDPSDDWANYPASPANSEDMDIDLVPSTADDSTRWAPALADAVWARREGSTNTTADVYTTSNLSHNYNFHDCGVTPSRRLTQYSGASGASNIRDYINTVTANGNTYHDIGLLWGARLMSPTGIFASDNATTPGGAQIQRHMIFMTDGDTANSYNNYASYGIEWWDRRQIDPTGLTTSQYATKLETNNNARAAALCTAIKNKGITLWVISYGGGVNATTLARLQACATSTDYFFQASNATDLITQFRNIADKISQLRLTQ